MKLVRSPLRISLCGGGSDVPTHYEEHGGAVVSMAINKYIYITSKTGSPLFPNKYRLVYSKVEELNDPDRIKHRIIKDVVNYYSCSSLDLDVMSDIPAGTGLGSSSAFTVGMHLSLGSPYLKHNKQALAERACETEIVRLRESIGKQDQYASALGGLNCLEFGKGVIIRPLSLYGLKTVDFIKSFNLYYVGGKRSASHLLKKQINKKNDHILNGIANCAQELYSSIMTGRFEDIGPLVLENWNLKKQLSPEVSNDRIDTIIETALKNGATGGKLLGAGGAGFVLLVCPPHKWGPMNESLNKFKLTHVPFSVDVQGAKVLYENT